MDFYSQSDEEKSPFDEETALSNKAQGRHQVYVSLAAIVLFVAALYGAHRLLLGHEVVSAISESDFRVTLAGTFIALLLLTFLLSFESKISARLAQRLLLEKHMDLMAERLHYREDILRLVSDHYPGAIMIFDRQNKFFFVNEPAIAKYGRSSAEIIGQVPSHVMTTDQSQKLEIRLAEVRASRKPLEYVDRVTDDRGDTRFWKRHYEMIGSIPSMAGCIMLREEDLTSVIIERERREQMLKQVIDTLVAVVDRRDPYASGHSSRVGKLSKAIAQEMKLAPTLIDAAEIAGSLMNFGKVLVSRRILTKTSALSDEELQRVRDSILTSADILDIIQFEGPVVDTLRQVLERFDGTGTPDGLRGEDILVTARIVSVANSFVAFVSPRAHRDGLPFDQALEILGRDAGKAYDDNVIKALSAFITANANKLGWLMIKKPKAPE